MTYLWFGLSGGLKRGWNKYYNTQGFIDRTMIIEIKLPANDNATNFVCYSLEIF